MPNPYYTSTDAYNDGYIAYYYQGKPDTPPAELTDTQQAFWLDGYDRGKDDLEHDHHFEAASTI